MVAEITSASEVGTRGSWQHLQGVYGGQHPDMVAKRGVRKLFNEEGQRSSDNLIVRSYLANDRL